MLVQRVVMPGSCDLSRGRCWATTTRRSVPMERYLAYLTDIERSPNTVKAYAHDLKDFWEFLDGRGLDWREVAAGGPRRVRRLAAAAAAGPGGRGGGAALGRART